MNNEIQTWLVYILKCADGTLYTGATNNLEWRVSTHNAGKGAKYTKNRLPVELIYSEVCENHGRALKREHEIKQYSRADKLKLIGAS